MSEPTQQDRERAKTAAQQALDSKFGYVPLTKGTARVMLSLLAEREATPSDSFYATRSLIWATKARASGRRAGLLEMAEWCEAQIASKKPVSDWLVGLQEAYAKAASHARAMASQEPGT